MFQPLFSKISSTSFPQLLCVLSGSILFVGCASQSHTYKNVPEFYYVRSGDTLSKIAMRYHLDYNNIARLNNIYAVDKIYVNQKLRLRPAAKKTNTPKQHVYTTPTAQQRVATTATPKQYSTTLSKPSTYAPVQPVVIYPQNNNTQVATNTYQNTHTYPNSNQNPYQNLPTTYTTPPVGQTEAISQQWTRPSRGTIIRPYNEQSKNVFFSGHAGEPVYAAATGQIVYAANNKKYGNLILIEHYNGYISAYRNIDRLLVQAGQYINAGEQIAEVGQVGNMTGLEFQIRYNGIAVDPKF